MHREEVRTAAAVAIAAPVLIGLLLGPSLAGAGGSLPKPGDAPAPETVEAGSQGPYTGLEHVAQIPGVSGGSGLWIEGDYAYLSSYGSDRFYVVDVSDPTAPQKVGETWGYTRDAAYLQADGRDIVVASGDGSGLRVIGVTDKTDPTRVDNVGVSSHNAVVLPGTDYVYNSDSSGLGASNEIIDVSNPDDAQVVARFGSFGCHDMEFHVGANRTLLLCPALEATQIFDVTDDPLDPELVTTIANPAISIHHWATTAKDGDLLIIGSEFGGGLGPGCGAHAQAAGVGASDTVGALWFYDLSNAETPVPLSWYKPTIPADNQLGGDWFYPSCTSHFGEVLDGRDQLVVGWYRAGTILVDFSDPLTPLQVDQWYDGSVTWDARPTGDGYVVTGDLTRGGDVLKLTGS